MSANILVGHDELDVADLFRQRSLHRATGQGSYLMHFAAWGTERWIGSPGVSDPRLSPTPLPSDGNTP
jgi:hypothetical protein